MESRRDFFKKATLAGASMLAAPSLLADTLSDKKTTAKVRSTEGIESKLIVPKAQGLQITGTFLDYRSNVISHQNWG